MAYPVHQCVCMNATPTFGILLSSILLLACVPDPGTGEPVNDSDNSGGGGGGGGGGNNGGDSSDDPTGGDSGMAELTFEITGLEDSQGRVRIAVCGSKECYDALVDEQNPTLVASLSAPANQAGVSITTALPPGEYTGVLHHDQNDNGVMDTNFLGLPQEGFGFSNGAHAGLSAPDYSAVKVTVQSGQATVTTIDADYL